MKAMLIKIARAVVPEGLRAWQRRHFGWRWFHGDFASWAEARTQARGYDDQAVLQRVVEAARTVRAGHAAWDRDGVVFMKPDLHHPLLHSLQAVAQAEGGRLELVDFGGGLGGTWWQHRHALSGVEVRWRIVEQAGFVEAGRREFADDVLSFHTGLSEALATGPVRVLLLSSVLSYLEKPHDILAEAIEREIPHIIVDRTPFVAGGQDRLVIQCTPPHLGGGSYPCWLFHRERLIMPFRQDYELIAEWPVPFDRVDGTAVYGGMHFRRRPGASVRPR